MSSKADTWMPFYVADYARDTLHLTRDMHGGYLLLLMACWGGGGRLRNEPSILAAITKATPREWDKTLAPVLLPFFKVDGPWLVHGRVLAEHEKAARLSEARRESGSKGGRPKKQTETNPKPIGSAKRNLSGSQTETPSPSPTPDGVKKDADASSLGSAAPDPTGGKLKADPWSKDADFGKLWDAATAKMRSRAKSKAKVWPHWQAARKWFSGEDLISALKAYLVGDPDVGRTGGPGLHIWLGDKTFEGWMGGDDTAVAVVHWSGPAEVRSIIEDALGGPEKAVSWLRACVWRDVPARAVVSSNSFVVEHLRKLCGGALEAEGVQILIETGRAA